MGRNQPHLLPSCRMQQILPYRNLFALPFLAATNEIVSAYVICFCLIMTQHSRVNANVSVQKRQVPGPKSNISDGWWCRKWRRLGRPVSRTSGGTIFLQSRDKDAAERAGRSRGDAGMPFQSKRRRGHEHPQQRANLGQPLEARKKYVCAGGGGVQRPDLAL